MPKDVDVITIDRVFVYFAMAGTAECWASFNANGIHVTVEYFSQRDSSTAVKEYTDAVVRTLLLDE
jgi:hypothetical protein